MIEELYHGEKYGIMSAVTEKALQLCIDERIKEDRTWIEMELVRQTLMVAEQMKKKGDWLFIKNRSKFQRNGQYRLDKSGARTV